MPKQVMTTSLRETPVLDVVTGKPICFQIIPPGYVIGFRPKKTKVTYLLPMQEALQLARQLDQRKIIVPKSVQDPDIPTAIKDVLIAKRRLKLVQIQKELKAKRIDLDSQATKAIMWLMVSSGQVKKQDGEYAVNF